MVRANSKWWLGVVVRGLKSWFRVFLAEQKKIPFLEAKNFCKNLSNNKKVTNPKPLNNDDDDDGTNDDDDDDESDAVVRGDVQYTRYHP